MNAFANVTDAGAYGAPELQSRHPPERESIWHMGNAATRLVGFRHERKGQRARHDALDYRIDGTRELRPKSLASFFVPAPSLKDFILCFRSENNTSGHSLANNFRRTSDQETTLSGLFSWSALRRSSSARCSGLNASSPSRSPWDRLSHNAIANSARSPGGSLNSCASTLDSIGVILSCSIHCGKRVRWCRQDLHPGRIHRFQAVFAPLLPLPWERVSIWLCQWTGRIARMRLTI